jgi:hypothetical protein
MTGRGRAGGMGGREWERSRKGSSVTGAITQSPSRQTLELPNDSPTGEVKTLEFAYNKHKDFQTNDTFKDPLQEDVKTGGATGGER